MQFSANTQGWLSSMAKWETAETSTGGVTAQRANLQMVVDKLLCMCKLVFFPLNEHSPGPFINIVQTEVMYKAEV